MAEVFQIMTICLRDVCGKHRGHQTGAQGMLEDSYDYYTARGQEAKLEREQKKQIQKTNGDGGGRGPVVDQEGAYPPPPHPPPAATSAATSAATVGNGVDGVGKGSDWK
ncbi:hypothetical protein IAR55_004468 [Kwoniella newhampshirensis]|uniref:Uncharacterized protein n=1 Tax=Kwoniella newhampshirensis TaxID=1651941 RepID=A0AAW0Z0P2_9TREE